MSKNWNRYRLVHEMSRIAKENQEEDRRPLLDKKNNYYKEVNKVQERRNYALEAYEHLIDGKKIEKADGGEKAESEKVDEK